MHRHSLALSLGLSVFACTAAPVKRTETPLHLRPENAAVPGRLTVTISGIDGVRGQLYVELYDEATYFDYARVLNERIVPVDAMTMTVVLEHVPAGRYLVVVSHDANANDTMDTGVFGVPLERYGFSRDARGLFGPPAFAEAAFDFEADATVSVTLR